MWDSPRASSAPLSLSARIPSSHTHGTPQPNLDIVPLSSSISILALPPFASPLIRPLLCQGKLLALELLVKVLQNPQHAWGCVRDEFARQLRQPLCITLLRNCQATDSAAFQLAIKLLVAVMSKAKLRKVLKVGACAQGKRRRLRPTDLRARRSPSTPRRPARRCVRCTLWHDAFDS